MDSIHIIPATPIPPTCRSAVARPTPPRCILFLAFSCFLPAYFLLISWTPVSSYFFPFPCLFLADFLTPVASYFLPFPYYFVLIPRPQLHPISCMSRCFPAYFLHLRTYSCLFPAYFLFVLAYSCLFLAYSCLFFAYSSLFLLIPACSRCLPVCLPV